MSHRHHRPAVGIETAHLGRLLILANGRPYAWHRFDESTAGDRASAAARLLPDAAECDAVLGAGWTVTAGRPQRLLAASQAMEISA